VSAGATALLESKPANFPARSWIAMAGLIPSVLCCGLLRKRWRGLALVFLLGIVAVAFVGACGGGGSGGGGGGGTGGGGGGGTSGGGGGSNMYSLTVTAAPSNTSAVTTLGTVTVTVTH
jgi:uncharacterized membrane protein YgcG